VFHEIYFNISLVSKAKLRIILFFGLIITSPWFITLSVNSQMINYTLPPRLIISNQHFVDNINTLRGELGPTNMISKLLVNKPVFFAKEVFQRYFESFDPSFLFFKGDPETTKSSHLAGAIYLSFLPFFLYGAYKNKPLILLLIVLAVPAAFFAPHFETLTRIPFLIGLTYLTALGTQKAYEKDKRIFFILVAFLFFEILRFFHNYTVHYPWFLAELLNKT